jgi:hypothetical protein
MESMVRLENRPSKEEASHGPFDNTNSRFFEAAILFRFNMLRVVEVDIPMNCNRLLKLATLKF